MKKIILALLLVLALVSTSEGQRNLRKIQRGNPTGSGDPLRSTAGGSPPAGETEPAAGTVLFGYSSASENMELAAGANYEIFFGAGYTATWAESASTTTASKVRIWVAGWDGGDIKAIIRTAGSIITNGITNGCSGSYGNPDGSAYLELSFATPPTITKGTTYTISYIIGTAVGFVPFGSLTGTNTMYAETGGTYASPSSTANADETYNGQMYAVVVK